MDPQILVIVRASPVRERTFGLLESILSQRPIGLVRTTVLRHRRSRGVPEFGMDGVEELPLEADALAQLESVAKESGCRWLVLPSSGDRYLPEAFAAVARRGERRNQTIVGPCRVLRDGQSYAIGPAPFRFDYFALLSGFSYIAPGATFISVDQLLESGGFDPRFPNALTYRFLLMIGAAHGVNWCSEPVLETEANPFPGVPSEVAVLYATEVLSAALAHNPGLPAPGATLGLAVSLAEYLEPMQSLPFYDKHLVWAIGLARSGLRDRYHEYFGLTSCCAGESNATTKN
jgi:hypothetical protein